MATLQHLLPTNKAVNSLLTNFRVIYVYIYTFDFSHNQNFLLTLMLQQVNSVTFHIS